MDYKYAVYPGTITPESTGIPTYISAEELVDIYGINGKPYLVVPESGPSPFGPDNDEVSYIHLKPRTDGNYTPAPVNYKEDTNATYPDIDFDNNAGGKWIVPKRSTEIDS